MSGEEAVNRATRRSASGAARLGRAWRALPSDRRLAAAAALGLFVCLFLPWYQETGLRGARTGVRTATASLTGWAAFSWVEAAVLLVAVGILALLFLRAEGRAFHLPGGDGIIVSAAGGWTCLLVIWRIFDKQGVTSRGQFATTSGIEWGIFITLGVAGLLAYAGSRIRAAHQPEPPLPGEEEGGAADVAADAEPWPEELGSRAPGEPRAAGGPARVAAPASSGAAARAANRASRRRPAAWAEPVTWDEPTAIIEPPVLSAPTEPSIPTEPPTPTAPTRVVEPADGPRQRRITLDEDKPRD